MKRIYFLMVCLAFSLVQLATAQTLRLQYLLVEDNDTLKAVIVYQAYTPELWNNLPILRSEDHKTATEFPGEIVILDGSVINYEPSSLERFFSATKEVKAIRNLKYLNTSKVTSMKGMFSGCHSLKSLDLSTFKTSNVTNMSSMFSGCSSLNSLDLSSFNTSNVVDMEYMFRNCKRLVSVNLSSFNTSNVLTMGMMFGYCEHLRSLDLSSFTGSKVMLMTGMFINCFRLMSLRLSPNMHAKMSKLADASGMFAGCMSLIDIRAVPSKQTQKAQPRYTPKKATTKPRRR